MAETPSTSAISSSVSPPKNRSSTIRLCRGSSLRQLVQRLVQRNHVHWPLLDYAAPSSRATLLPPAPLGRTMMLGMIDQNLAHQVGRDAEELRAAGALHLRLVHQPQVGLVDQRRRLQRVVRPLAADIGGREAAQFAVDERHQFAQCLLVAAAPGLEQSRYFPGSRCRHSPPRSTRLYTAGGRGYETEPRPSRKPTGTGDGV